MATSVEQSADTVLTHADLHHHGALEARPTVTDEASRSILTRTVTTHVVRQTTLVDVCYTHRPMAIHQVTTRKPS